MKTAELLKSITDRALYERIANSVLRFKFPPLNNLIEGGINERGETVKGHLDSFCRINDTDFALIEHTTDDSDLERKWLYDLTTYRGKKQKPDRAQGDLLKAIREANLIRDHAPKAQFTIYLTTNQNVGSELWGRVVAIASKHNVSVELIELKTIAHFLDFDSNGQYIRKKFLGIDQELFSIDVLNQVQSISFEQYATDAFIDKATVWRDWNLVDLKKVLEHSSNQLTLILAESGYGKSTLCHSLMCSLIQQGECCLRVNGAFIENSISAFDAIERYIIHVKPKIFFSQESRVQLTSTDITLVVDDINQAVDPLKMLEKLLAWSFAAKAHRGLNLKIVCPVWPRNYSRLPDITKKDGTYNIFSFDKPSLETAEAIAKLWFRHRGLNLSEVEIRELIQSSGRDPLLLNLSMHMVNSQKLNIQSVGTKVIESFALNKITGIIEMPAVKIRVMLQKIAICLLTNRRLNPHYTDLERWLNNEETIRFLDVLASEGTLLSFNQSGILQFRHDRIRDFILSEGLAVVLQNRQNYSEILNDPYFAHLLGGVISNTDLTQKDLDELIGVAPQAVFSSLKYLQNNHHQTDRLTVMNSITKWRSAEAFKEVHPVVLRAISEDLSQSDLMEVTEIAKGFPPNLSIWASMLRNGVVEGGILFLLSYPEFEPFMGNRYRDLLIDHAALHHRDKLVGGLKMLIAESNLTEAGLKGVLLLSGYLKDARMVETVVERWKQAPTESLLLYYLWASINCLDINNQDDVFTLLDFLTGLPFGVRDPSGFPRSVRDQTLYYFRKVNWTLNEEQISLLANRFHKYKDFIACIFDNLDSPTALKVVVDCTAENLERAHKESTYTLLNLGDMWDFERTGYRLKSCSLAFLLGYWQNSTNTIKQREVAYSFWTGNADKNDVIKEIATISHNDLLFAKTIRTRIILGDTSAITLFSNLVLKKPFQIQIAHLAWNSEMKEVFRRVFIQEQSNFGKTDIRHFLVEILRLIPQADAEELLLEYWEEVCKDIFGTQTALFIATMKSVALADKKIKSSTNPSELFMYVDQSYMCYERTYEKRITVEKLDTLKPYLKYIKKESLKVFANQCLRSGFDDWLKSNLLPHLDKDTRIDVAPSIHELANQLKDAIGKRSAHFWLGNLKDRKISRDLIISALELFSEQVQNDDEFAILADLLGRIGTRTELHILNQVDVENLSIERTNIVTSRAHYEVFSRTLV